MLQIMNYYINSYSPEHKCWPKTSWAGNQGDHKIFAPSLGNSILATQEPLTAFLGIKQKNLVRILINGHGRTFSPRACAI